MTRIIYDEQEALKLIESESFIQKKYISKNLLNNEEFILKALALDNPSIVWCIPDKLLNNLEFVLKALKFDNRIVSRIAALGKTEFFKNDEILSSVMGSFFACTEESDWRALGREVEQAFKSEEIVLKALKKLNPINYHSDERIYSYFDFELFKNEDFWLKVLEINPLIVQDHSNYFKNKDFVKKAIEILGKDAISKYVDKKMLEQLGENDKCNEGQESKERPEDLENLSPEELLAIEADLDRQIEENEKTIAEQQRKALIERIQGKRAKIVEQQAQLAELLQEKDSQPPKNSQQR